MFGSLIFPTPARSEPLFWTQTKESSRDILEPVYPVTGRDLQAKKEIFYFPHLYSRLWGRGTPIQLFVLELWTDTGRVPGSWCPVFVFLGRTLVSTLRYPPPRGHVLRSCPTPFPCHLPLVSTFIHRPLPIFSSCDHPWSVTPFLGLFLLLETTLQYNQSYGTGRYSGFLPCVRVLPPLWDGVEMSGDSKTLEGP